MQLISASDPLSDQIAAGIVIVVLTAVFVFVVVLGAQWLWRRFVERDESLPPSVAEREPDRETLAYNLGRRHMISEALELCRREIDVCTHDCDAAGRNAIVHLSNRFRRLARSSPADVKLLAFKRRAAVVN